MRIFGGTYRLGTTLATCVAWCMLACTFGFAQSGPPKPPAPPTQATPHHDSTKSPAADSTHATAHAADTAALVEPDWYLTMKDAEHRASTTDRQILCVVYADWCRWCKALEDSVLGSAAVDSLRERVVCVKVNGDKDTELVSRLRIQGYPTILLLDKTGNEVDRILGYQTPHQFLKWCDNALKGVGTLWTLEKDQREHRDDYKVMFALGRKHLTRGQFEEASNFFENLINQDLGNTSGKADSCMFELAMIHRRDRDWYKAVEGLKELLKQYPETNLKEEANLYIPWLLSRAGDLEEAIKLYKSFLDRFGGSTEAKWVQDQIDWLESRDEGKS